MNRTASSVPAGALLAELLEAFALPPAGAVLAPHGAGRIHQSYRLVAGGSAYLLQRVNTRVFREPQQLASNLERVTAHLAAARGAHGPGVPQRRCLQLVPARDGGTLYRSRQAGSLWRLFPFVTGSRGPSTPPAEHEVYEAARCFGAFVREMAGLEGPPLALTIPGFHDTAARYRAFEAAVARDPLGRTRGAWRQIRSLREHRELAAVVDELAQLGSVPERIVHNDCKLDNVLFDAATGDALCVVDLDTVMPGCVLHDVGDLVRSAASAGGEDEDGAPLHLDLHRFECVLQGYLAGSGDLLTSAERANLAVAARVVTFELALRFLTDHLLGDQYFGAAHPAQNLARADRQLQLLESMVRRSRDMAAVVRQLAG